MKRVIIMSPVPTIIILPSGGWTSKKNVLLMYKEPILPKFVSSQQTQAGWSTRCSLVQTVRSSTELSQTRATIRRAAAAPSRAGHPHHQRD